MFPIYLLYLLPLIFLAYFLKATAGFGSMILMLAVGSLIIGPVPALLLTAFLDVVGGLALLKIDSTNDSKRLWLPLSAAMLIGVVCGALLLKLIALPRLQYVLGATLLVVGLWLIVFKRPNTDLPTQAMPLHHTVKDLVVCFIAGTSGGLTGISAPPVLYYFGSRFGKEALRRILTRIFLVESLTRITTYSLFGVMQLRIVLFGLAAIPVMYLALYVGNHAFFKIPETWFRRLAGVIAVLSAIRLVTS
jgi:uncharacterized membrane protein YfcA